MNLIEATNYYLNEFMDDIKDGQILSESSFYKGLGANDKRFPITSVKTTNIEAFHGSKGANPLMQYDRNQMNSDNAELGMFFTSSDSYADAYGKVFEFTLSFKNPVIVYADDLVDAGLFDVIQDPNNPAYSGHDGIIVLGYGRKRGEIGYDWYDVQENTDALKKKFGRYVGEQMDYWGQDTYIVFRDHLKDVVKEMDGNPVDWDSLENQEGQ